MRKVKEVLRLKFDVKLSNRRVAQSCLMPHNTVGEYRTHEPFFDRVQYKRGE